MIRGLKKALAVAAISLFSASPASATGEINCRASDGRSGEIFMIVGRLPVLNVISAEITAFGKTWSTRQGAANPVIVGQAYQDNTQLFVDFTDTNVETILISLRTVRVSTKNEYGEAGVLRIAEAVYPVICES